MCFLWERWIFDQDLLKIHLIWRQVSSLSTRQREGYLYGERQSWHWLLAGPHQLDKNIQQRYTSQQYVWHTNPIISGQLNISEISAGGLHDFTDLRRIYGTIININPCYGSPVAGRGGFICPLMAPQSAQAWPGRAGTPVLARSPCAVSPWHRGRTTHCVLDQGIILQHFEDNTKFICH